MRVYQFGHFPKLPWKIKNPKLINTHRVNSEKPPFLNLLDACLSIWPEGLQTKVKEKRLAQGRQFPFYYLVREIMHHEKQPSNELLFRK